MKPMKPVFTRVRPLIRISPVVYAITILAITIGVFFENRTAQAMELEGRLIDAAACGNLAILKKAIVQGADVNRRTNIYGYTALHLACKFGHMNAVEILLKHGADVNKLSQSERSPLWLAINYGHRDLARLLVSRGANIEVTNVVGETPLIAAARVGDAAIAEFLLKKGAKPNVMNSAESTASETAFLHRHYNVAKVLIEHGKAAFSEGARPCVESLEAVLSGDWKKIKKALNDYQDDKGSNPGGCSPLIIASALGKVSLMKDLLENDARKETANKEINRALMQAARTGMDESARFLLDRGADINYHWKNRETPLTEAADQGRLSVVKLLLDSGANIHWRGPKKKKDTKSKRRRRRGPNQKTPLMAACSWKAHEPVVRLLLERGADTNARDDHGCTALIFASQSGDLATVALLLEKGADVNIATKGGRTPLTTACKTGRSDLVKLLISRGATTNVFTKSGYSPLMIAALKGYSAIVEVLLENGVDPNQTNSKGMTPLIFSAFFGSEHAADVLLKNGAKVNIRDDTGTTALMYGVSSGSVSFLKRLLKEKPDATVKNTDGETAVTMAESRGHEEAAELIKAYISNYDKKGEKE